MTELSFHIRDFDFSDTDYEAAAAVNNACWPDQPVHINNLKEWDETYDKKLYYFRQMIEADGQIVAVGLCCEPEWSYEPGRYFVEVEVIPEYRRRGIATAWYAQIRDILKDRDPAPQELLSSSREDQPAAIVFLEKIGFEQAMRYPASRLMVNAFDPAPFDSVVERVAQYDDVEIKTLTEIMETDGDYRRKYYEMESAIMKDVPTPGGSTVPDFETFCTQHFESEYFISDAFIVAVASDGQYVGTSTLWPSEASPERLYTGLTGVRREYRQRGLATALKIRGIAFAKQYGVTEIHTDNEENNPMYQINLKLGFEPLPAWLDFVKKLA